MSEATLNIKPWGNNLGVRLPAAVARAAQLHANQRVQITVEGGRVIITPLHDQPATLADRLARFDLAVHGGEAMAAAPVSRETRRARRRVPPPGAPGPAGHHSVSRSSGSTATHRPVPKCETCTRCWCSRRGPSTSARAWSSACR
jgi:antitoxin MazE